MKKSLSFMLAVILALSLAACGAKKSIEEQYAVRNTKILRSMMKDPDSFKLRDDVVVIVDEKNHIYYTFISASGSNSYGASIRSVSIFKDGKYFSDLDDEDELLSKMNEAERICKNDNNEENREKFFSASNDYILLLRLKKWYVNGANYNHTDIDGIHIVTTTVFDQKSIGRQAKVDYEK